MFTRDWWDTKFPKIQKQIYVEALLNKHLDRNTFLCETQKVVGWTTLNLIYA